MAEWRASLPQTRSSGALRLQSAFSLARQHPFVPSHQEVAEFLADFHGLNLTDFFDDLFERTGEDVVRHLFHVAASLDSMVVGEAQILSQVKQAYELATSVAATGPLTNSVFQGALRVAKRVATETAIQQIPKRCGTYTLPLDRSLHIRSE